MNVQLSSEIEEIIDSQVRIGRFASRQEVIEAGICLLDGISIEERSKRHASLRKTIADTLASHKVGDEVPFDREKIRNAGMALLADRKHAK